MTLDRRPWAPVYSPIMREITSRVLPLSLLLLALPGLPGASAD